MLFTCISGTLVNGASDPSRLYCVCLLDLMPKSGTAVYLAVCQGATGMWAVCVLGDQRQVGARATTEVLATVFTMIKGNRADPFPLTESEVPAWRRCHLNCSKVGNSHFSWIRPLLVSLNSHKNETSRKGSSHTRKVNCTAGDFLMSPFPVQHRASSP